MAAPALTLRALGAAALLALAACAATPPSPAPPAPAPIDPRATPETRALFANLRILARGHVLFGHQDDLAYGHTWAYQPGRSDVKEVAGSYPAVYGWEIGRIEHGAPNDLDGVPFAAMHDWIVDAYRRGAVVTISWHADNPVSGGDAWDTTRAVAAILPGGPRHDLYLQWLDRVAAFLAGLRAPDGTPVPVVFRPFHEMSGGWFWWGAKSATPEEYRRLWRFTVEYLRDRKGLHNLLWAYAPNASGSTTAASYWETYPGDAYVDVLGLDDYSTLQSGPDPVGAMAAELAWLARAAEARGKIPALTETGYEAIPDSTWWTGRVLAALQADPAARRIAWLLVWRNAPVSEQHPHHFFAPYAGHSSAADFVRFAADPLILLEDDLPQLYRLPLSYQERAIRADGQAIEAAALAPLDRAMLELLRAH